MMQEQQQQQQPTLITGCDVIVIVIAHRRTAAESKGILSAGRAMPTQLIQFGARCIYLFFYFFFSLFFRQRGTPRKSFISVVPVNDYIFSMEKNDFSVKFK